MRFAFLQVAGGILVLGSYALWLSAHDARPLWGSMPSRLEALYGYTMIAAALGYFPMTAFFLRHREEATLARARGTMLVEALYAGMFLGSALWMPLTYAWLDSPSRGLWWAVRAVLVLVAASSLGLFVVLLRSERRDLGRTLALLGSALFLLQTGLLDPFVWPLFMSGWLLR